jgi:hypothetical protein
LNAVIVNTTNQGEFNRLISSQVNIFNAIKLQVEAVILDGSVGNSSVVNAAVAQVYVSQFQSMMGTRLTERIVVQAAHLTAFAATTYFSSVNSIIPAGLSIREARLFISEAAAHFLSLVFVIRASGSAALLILHARERRCACCSKLTPLHENPN